jgi:lysozyme family protein
MTKSCQFCPTQKKKRKKRKRKKKTILKGNDQYEYLHIRRSIWFWKISLLALFIVSAQ